MSRTSDARDEADSWKSRALRAEEACAQLSKQLADARIELALAKGLVMRLTKKQEGA